MKINQTKMLLTNIFSSSKRDSVQDFSIFLFNIWVFKISETHSHTKRLHQASWPKGEEALKQRLKLDEHL